MGKNNNLIKAKKEKNDEFYTQYEDIEKELKHYTDHLKDKIIYCNCDDPSFSNFYKYFADNFKSLGLKKLITTHYVKDGQSYKLELDEQGITKTPLSGNGDFRSEECIKILKTADIVITNPPFSLFREFLNIIDQHNKKILVIGNYNAITYKDIFNKIKQNLLWIGVSKRSMNFKLPNGDLKSVNACWFTNLEHEKRNKTLEISNTQTNFLNYEDYDAIEVSKTKEIPNNYKGNIGVPITFLTNHNPTQFEIIDCLEPCISVEKLKIKKDFKELKSRQKNHKGILCQKTYHRIIIKRTEI